MIIGIAILAIMNHVNLLFYSAETMKESLLFEHGPFLAGRLTALIVACFFTAALSAILFKSFDDTTPILIIGGIFTILSIIDFIMGTYPSWYSILSVLACLPSALLGYQFSIKIKE